MGHRSCGGVLGGVLRQKLSQLSWAENQRITAERKLFKWPAAITRCLWSNSVHINEQQIKVTAHTSIIAAITAVNTNLV